MGLLSGRLLEAGSVGGGPTYDSVVLADSPTIYLKFDETSGTSCTDSSGNGNTFTYQTGVTLAQAGLVNDGGYSVKGSGTAAAALLGSIPSALSNPTNFSLECWVNLTSTSLAGAFIKVGGSNGYGLGVGGTTLDNAGNNLIAIAENVAWVVPGLAIGTGTHYVAVTRNGAGWYFSIDGAYLGMVGATSINPATGSVSVAGYNNGTNRFLPSTERVDNVAIYTTSLTTTRVTAHYNAGI